MEHGHSITLRALCGLLAAAYALEAGLAVAGLMPGPILVMAIAIAIFAFATGRRLPADAAISIGDALSNSKVALLLLAAGFVSILIHTESSLSWVSIVHAYCAGNRLKAAGV